MSVRVNALAVILAAAAVPAVFAQGAGGFVGGEAGWVDRPVQGSLSPAQVRNEFLRFRADPVAADGGRYVGGEAGYLFPAHSYARVNGEWVCTDQIAHNASPQAVKSEAERRQFLQQYPA